MVAPSAIVRLLSAAMAAFVGAGLLFAKVHFNDEYQRLAVRGDAIVLPVAEVIGERASTSLAASAGDSRAN